MYQGNQMSVEETTFKTTASGANLSAGCDGAIGCFTLFDGNRNYKYGFPI